MYVKSSMNTIFPLDVGRSTLVGHRPMKSLLSVRPSVRCTSVCPSLSFLKIGPLDFSDIVHDDSWPWYLVTDEAWFLKKKIDGPKFGQVWFISFPLNCI